MVTSSLWQGAGVDASPLEGASRARLTAFVRGRVQGVGFRWWVRARALELGLAGSVTNLDDGRVQVVAQGEHGACIRLLELLAEQPSSAGRPGEVSAVTDQWSEPRDTGPGFGEG